MPSFAVKMWWAVAFTGLICIGLARATRTRHWGLVTLLSGFLVAGLFAFMMELMWWIGG